MRSRLLATTVLLVALTSGAVAIGHTGHSRQWAIAYLKQPTLVGSTIVEGPVLFVHDTAKMARGEPCTTIFLFEPMKGPTEEIVSFHCIPRSRNVVGTFTVRTRPNTVLGFGCVLTEYQFAGDAEGHGVPIPKDAL